MPVKLTLPVVYTWLLKETQKFMVKNYMYKIYEQEYLLLVVVFCMFLLSSASNHSYKFVTCNARIQVHSLLLPPFIFASDLAHWANFCTSESMSKPLGWGM